MDNNLWCDYFSYQFVVMYKDMHFACVTAVLTNHSCQRIGSHKYKNYCVYCMEFMCLIEMRGLLIATYSLGPGLDLYAHNLGENNSTDIG